MSVDPLVLIILIAALGPVLYFAARSMRRERRATKHLIAGWIDSLDRLEYRMEGWEALTTREIRIVELAANGKRNTEIAKELCVSTGTVANHLSNIYRKLGIRNRHELMRALHADRR